MEKLKNIIQNKIFQIIALLILPFIIDIFIYGTISINKATAIRVCFIYGIYAVILIYKVLNKYSDILKKVLEWLLKYRYIIAGIVLIVLVIGKINFSSMDSWRSFLGENQETDIIFGKARSIRSDEWLIQTPIAISQANGEEGIYNKDIAQGHVNILMSTAPVKDITAISRPLTWGFLLLGQEYGFAFYWSLKVVALIMVSIELALKISKKDKLLAITGGLMLALAPAVMWWISTAIAEAYMFGAAVIVLFGYYMENLDWKLWKKLLVALGILICLPAFAFELYPAYQVPFAYIMAIFMLNDFIKHRKELKKQDYMIMGGTIFLVLAIIARFLMVSKDDIKIMMSTVYPRK